MKKGFTLVELIAVMVVLAIILSITVPVVSNIIRPATRAAFRSDAALVLNTVNLKRIADNNTDIVSINADNIDDVLGLSNDNYKSVSFELIDQKIEVQSVAVRIEGQGKWEGLYACGNYFNIKVTNNYIECAGDIEPPVMTLIGNNPYHINLGDNYTEPGVKAIDNLDGDITSSIVVSGTINNSVPGTYTLTYTATDKSGNTGFITRDIIVVDNVNPVISLSMNGNNTYAQSRITTINVADDSPLNPEGLKYVWTTSTTRPDLLEFTNAYINNQNINTPLGVTGDYYLFVLAVDINGNETYLMSNVFKLDNTIPIITFNGNATVTIDKGATYTDAGATATDNIDGSIAVTSNGNVNPNIIGEYAITYNAKDSSGNNAISVVRTVIVRDVLAPVITILGDNPSNITLGSTYSDAGATAIDDVDGDVTSKIQTTSNVNVNIAGSYTVTYTVSDKQNNTATRTRTVNVQSITQYRYRTSSTSQSCQTCYNTCYYGAATASYWCSSGTLSGASCLSSYSVSSYMSCSYYCNTGHVWIYTCSCSGNCNAPCSDGSSPSAWLVSDSCPTYGTSCTSGSGGCSRNWAGTCSISSPANVSYSCPGGTYLSGTSCYYSCNPYACNCVPITVWSDWSTWSSTPRSSDATTEVQTRTCSNYPCLTT